MTTTVRVLTWNLWWRFGDWRRRQDAIEAVLQEVKPDICCFQEVWSTGTEDVARHLGDRNGLGHAARSYSSEPSIGSGGSTNRGSTAATRS